MGFHEPATRLKGVLALGGHPAARLGIELHGEDDGGLWRWLVAACLLGDRLAEPRVAQVLGELERAGLATPADLAKAEPLTLAALLSAADHRAAERRAAQLVRAAAALVTGFDGSLTRLAAGADDLDALGNALVGLAPGIGAGTVRRFLEPLRARWPAAAELPLGPAAAAAARHLGLPGAEDADPRALLHGVCVHPEAPSPAEREAAVDFEAALAQLGARACRREAPGRCPLGPACPLRGEGP